MEEVLLTSSSLRESTIVRWSGSWVILGVSEVLTRGCELTPSQSSSSCSFGSRSSILMSSSSLW